MKKENKTINSKIIRNDLELVNKEDFKELHKTDSIFMGINIAVLRQKQLKQGAHSRLVPDTLKHKNTIIAVEEVKQGLIAFTFVEVQEV